MSFSFVVEVITLLVINITILYLYDSFQPIMRSTTSGQKRVRNHVSDCFVCGDGGIVMECSTCPQVLTETALQNIFFNRFDL